MSYSPLNVSVYLRSFAGFLAGITAPATTDTNQGDYALYAQMADAFAQEVDTQFGSGVPTGFELDALAEGCEAVWENRSSYPSSQAVLPGAYLQIAQALVARVKQGNAQIVTQGINPNATASVGSKARVVTPNSETVFTTNFSPGTSKLLAVIDITPSNSGLLLASFTAAIVTAAPDSCEIVAFFVDNLTSVVGGTLIAPGVTAVPSATVPDWAVHGVEMFASFSPTTSVAGQIDAIVPMCDMPVQVSAPLHRVGIAFVAASTNAVQWQNVSAMATAIEQ